jgi:hypothetical protein
MDILSKANEKEIGVVEKEVVKEVEVESQVEKEVKKVERKELKDDDLVVVFNYFNGTLNLKSKEPEIYEQYVLTGFLDKTEVTFRFLKSLARQRSKVLKLPRIYISDENVVEQLKLEKIYEDILDPKDLSEVFSLSTAKIIEIIDNADSNLKTILRDLANSQIKSGKLAHIGKMRVLAEKLGVKTADTV